MDPRPAACTNPLISERARRASRPSEAALCSMRGYRMPISKARCMSARRYVAPMHIYLNRPRGVILSILSVYMEGNFTPLNEAKIRADANRAAQKNFIKNWTKETDFYVPEVLKVTTSSYEGNWNTSETFTWVKK